MLCVHEQEGGTHSKPNLHEPQQGENERERTTKERGTLSAKSTQWHFSTMCEGLVWETICCLEMSHWVCNMLQ